MFGPRESVANLEISPSGRYAVYIAPTRGTGSAAVVADIANGGDARPVLHASGAPERLSWCRFVSETRLICSVRGTSNIQGDLVNFHRLFAVSVDGSNIRELGQQSTIYDDALRQDSGIILDWLPDDGHAVLMARVYVPETMESRSRTVRRLDGLGVDRIDVDTLRSSQVEVPEARVANFMTDARGNVRIRETVEARSDGQAGSLSTYYYRLAGSRDW